MRNGNKTKMNDSEKFGFWVGWERIVFLLGANKCTTYIYICYIW